MKPLTIEIEKAAAPPRRAACGERCYSLTAEGRDELELGPGDFWVHERMLNYAPRSLCCLRDTNPFRFGLVWIITSWAFDNFILLLILLNTVMIACTDYSVIDRETLTPAINGVSTLPPYADAHSWMNQLQAIVDPIFTGLFIVEMLLKVPAMGFVLGKGSYLRNAWNWIDMVVVYAGIIGFIQIPGAPSISVLRAVRVIRPLKSLTAIPRLRALVGAILSAVPDLLGVVAVLGLLFTIFGILGLDLFSGLMHFRCRLTEFPVALPADLFDKYNADAAAFAAGGAMSALVAQVVNNRTAHPRCADAGGAALAPLSDAWSVATSPWRTQRDCVWPIDYTDDRVCNDGSATRVPFAGQKVYTCPASTYCGSAYDDFGNARFTNRKHVQAGIYNDARNFGFSTFDNIIAGFLTIFQCVTLEGWIDITYNLMDAYGWTSAAVMFTTLVFLGGFFLLNLTLAVLGDRFNAELEADAIEEEEKRVEDMLRSPRGNVALSPAGGTPSPERGVPRKSSQGHRRWTNVLPPPKGARLKIAMWWSVCSGRLTRWWQAPVVDDEGRGIAWCKCCKPLHCVVTSFAFRMFINVLIIANTLVLALDSYPVQTTFSLVLEYFNFALTLLFVLEMVFKFPALGFRQYIKDGFNIFDAIIVFASLVEMLLAPPSFFAIAGFSGSGGGSLGALRTFRVFRLFKLARSWQALQDLLVTIVRSLVSGMYFMMLLFLFVLIFTLVGQQFFANRFYFDETTHYAVDFKDVATGAVTAYRPRSNFDSLFRSAASVFQVLTGENWNTIMYDGMRSTGGGGETRWAWASWASALYFVSLVSIGTFVLLDFFIAILLNDFGQIEHTHDGAPKKAATAPPPNFVRTAFDNAKKCCTNCRRCKCKSEEESTAGGDDGGTNAGADDGASAETTATTRGEAWDQWARGTSFAEVTLAVLRVLTIQTAFRSFQARKFVRLMREAVLVEPLQRLRMRGKSCFVCKGNDFDSDGEEGKPFIVRQYITSFVSYSLADIPCFRFGKGDSVMVTTKVDEFNIGTERGEIVAIRADRAYGHGAELGDTVVKFDVALTSWRKLELVPVLKNLKKNGIESIDMAGLRVELPNICAKDLAELMNAYDADGSKSLSTSELEVCLDHEKGVVQSGVRREFMAKLWGSELVDLATMVSFDSFIMLCIVGSSVLMAIDNPLLDPNSGLVSFIFAMEITVNIIFTIELVLKSIAWGFVCGREAYLTDPWNVLDFVVVIISWLTMMLTSISALKSLKSLRLLRVFRVLRAINKLPGLKAITKALLHSVVPLLTVIPVIILIFTIFAILFMDQLKGGLSACDGTALTTAQQALIMDPVEYSALDATQKAWADNGTYDSMTSKAVCLWLGQEWAPVVDQSFDNIVVALGTLIQLSTTEAWIDVALAAVDSRGMDMQPKEGNNEWWLVVFIIFEGVGAFFLVNLFIGVLLVQFERMKKQSEQEGETGSMLLSEGQQKWLTERNATEHKLEPKKRMRELRPKLPSQLLVYRLLTEKLPYVPWITFDGVISACIALNTLALGLEFFGQPYWLTVLLSVANWFFAIVFSLESIIKIVAFGLVGYLRDAWNVFDFVVVVMTMLSFVIGLAAPELSVGSAITILRVLRLGRIFRLIKGARAVRVVFDTMLNSIPAMMNITVLLALVFFIFTIVAQQLFSKVALPDDGALNEHANFQSFSVALLTLIRAGTGEGWPDFVYALAGTTDGCVADPVYDSNMCGFSDPQFSEDCVPINGCGDPYISHTFWYVFTVVVGAIMLNLVVFYIIEAFDEANNRENVLDPADEDRVISHWLIFDPDCHGVVEDYVLTDVFQTLPQPLGFKYVPSKDDSHKRRKRLLHEVLEAKIKLMDIPSHRVKTRTLYRLSDVVVAIGLRMKRFEDSGLDIDAFEGLEMQALYAEKEDLTGKWLGEVFSPKHPSRLRDEVVGTSRSSVDLPAGPLAPRGGESKLANEDVRAAADDALGKDAVMSKEEGAAASPPTPTVQYDDAARASAPSAAAAKRAEVRQLLMRTPSLPRPSASARSDVPDVV